jgi:hypothetical protein
MVVDTEWKLVLNDSPGFDEYVIFREVGSDGKIIKEFALQSPSYAKLYYALMDWFGDSPKIITDNPGLGFTEDDQDDNQVGWYNC